MAKASTQKRGSGTSVPPAGGGADAQLQAALAAVEADPSQFDAWDALEELAAKRETPDEVSELYVKVFSRDLPAKLASQLGERAQRFHGEWFGDDAPANLKVLTRVLELDPSADWALERLTVVLTSAARYDELLAVYDRALAGKPAPARRLRLLEEAVNVAKDFARADDRAIGYLTQLRALKPADAGIAASLERLLERQGKPTELIALWRSRLDDASPADAAALRTRIAEAFLEKLGDPKSALGEARELLDAHREKEALPLLERITEAKGAAREVREAAVALLRSRYSDRGRDADVVRVLEAELARADEREAPALRRELATRLSAQGSDDAALTQWLAVLALLPDDSTAETQSAALAGKTGAHAAHAAGLVTAAERASAERGAHLLGQAAEVYAERAADPAKAIALYEQVLTRLGEGSRAALPAARRLSTLLERENRSKERLDVLDRLAALEPDKAERRSVLAEIARTARQTGDVDRALAAWQRRIDEDSADVDALSARIEILATERRLPELVEALERRAASPAILPFQKRADLVHAATLLGSDLADLERSVAGWRRVATDFGEDSEVVDALDALYTRQGAFAELADLLARAATRDTRRVADLLARLGDAVRERLADASRAAVAYRDSLRIDPREARARSGLRALLDDEGARRAAVDGLVASYEATGDVTDLLAILEPRLAVAENDASRVRILREAATLSETSGDLPGALAAVARAFVLAPVDLVLESHLLRFATMTKNWDVAANALRDAAAAESARGPRANALLLVRAALLADQVGDHGGALDSYETVATAEPARRDVALASLRTAAAAGRWDIAATRLVAHAGAIRELPTELVAALESDAAAKHGEGPAVAALEAAVAAAPTLSAKLRSELEWTAARWHRDRRQDLVAAEAALHRAVALAPEDDALLRTLVDVARRSPSRELYDALGALGARDTGSVDAFHEAAELALGPLAGNGTDTRQALERLYGRAAQLLSRGAPGTGRDPYESASFAIDRLLVHFDEQGANREAYVLLTDASRLPLPAERTRAFRARAADLAAVKLKERGRAIDLLRGLLDESPGDAKIADQLAELYAQDERLADLLALRKEELATTKDPERRVTLRLALAELVGKIEARGGRMEALHANLDERPGHPETIAMLSAVLTEKRQHAELTDVLAAQAQRLETSDAPRAATLFEHAAALAENQLHDTTRARALYRRVVSLAATATALDALARLATARGDHTEAVTWLERRLGHEAPLAERTRVSLALARAHLGAEQTDRAIARLETTIQADPASWEARELLMQLYRDAGAWAKLAELLADSASHVKDDSALLPLVREAADVWVEKLRTPEKAIPVLETATRLSPDDRALRRMLGESYTAGGRLGEARAIFEALVAEFGRRRSAERASLHVALADVARREGDRDAALTQLDQAASMDSGNARVLLLTGEIAREAKQLDRAERALRALLLVVRRHADDPDAAVGIAEVQFELSRLAAERGDAAQASEQEESAIAAAAQSAVEAARFRRALEARGERALLVRVLEARLAASTTPEDQSTALVAMAEVLEAMGGRDGDAFDARLRALDGAPGDAAQHDAARALAKKAGRSADYAKALETLAERMRRREEGDLAAELTLRHGRVAEEDLADLDRAAHSFRKVESSGLEVAAARVALARVARAKGDAAEERRVLDAVVAEADDGSPAVTDALYRIAELRLAHSQNGDVHDHGDGLATIERAIAREPRWPRAAAILREHVAHATPTDALVALYERAARASGDPAILLDYLERRVAMPGATLAEIKEGVDLAIAQGENARADALLARGMEIADAQGGLGNALWTATTLADRRAQAGDVPGALDALGKAVGAASSDEAPALERKLATLAGLPGGDLELAAKTWEALRERDAADRTVWEPLFEVYGRSGEKKRVAALVSATLDALLDPAERNALRMMHARFLLERKSEKQGIAVLKDVLGEDPDHVEAGRLLGEILERAGSSTELVDLVGRQLDGAKDKGDATNVVALSLRLAQLYETDSRFDDALDVVRSGLDFAPTDRGLLEALVRRTAEAHPRDRAEAMERLLAVAEGDAAGKLAREIAALHEELEDDDAVVRVLALGHRQAQDDDALRARLETIYRDREDHEGLAAMLLLDGERGRDVGKAVVRLREAAAIYLERLGRPADAAQAYGIARMRDPEDDQILAELIEARSRAGDVTAAIGELGSAIEARPSGPGRAMLLRQRGALHLARAEDDAATADLEEAYAIDADESAGDLTRVLDDVRQRAAARGAHETERATTLRLVAILSAHGHADPARDLLAGWTDRAPADVDALRMLADVDARGERWGQVAVSAARLAAAETGEAQIDAALLLADAAARAGHPGDAREGLETVFAAQPEDVRIRDRLRALYADVGAHAELAGILTADAYATEDAAVRFELLRRAGSLYLAAGDPTAALTPLAAAYELQPTDHELVVALADTYTLTGAHAEASQLLEAAIAAHGRRRTPELASLQQRMGRLAGAAGAKDTEIEWYKVALDSDKNSGDIAADLADLAMELGDHETALKALRAITLLKTPGRMSRGTAFLRQAQIAQIKGDPRRAILWARKAKEEEPGLAEADEFLKSLGE